MVSKSVSTKKPNRIIIKIFVTLSACYCIYALLSTARTYQQMWEGLESAKSQVYYASLSLFLTACAIFIWTVLFIKEKLSKFWLGVGFLFILFLLIFAVLSMFMPLVDLTGAVKK